MKPKYKLTEDFCLIGTYKVYRIKALRDFKGVRRGQAGGWVESYANLSQDGECWIGGNAAVCDDAYVCGDARVLGLAIVGGSAVICDRASVRGALVEGDAFVGGQSMITQDVKGGRYV